MRSLSSPTTPRSGWSSTRCAAQDGRASSCNESRHRNCPSSVFRSTCWLARTRFRRRLSTALPWSLVTMNLRDEAIAEVNRLELRRAERPARSGRPALTAGGGPWAKPGSPGRRLRWWSRPPSDRWGSSSKPRRMAARRPATLRWRRSLCARFKRHRHPARRIVPRLLREGRTAGLARALPRSAPWTGTHGGEVRRRETQSRVLRGRRPMSCDGRRASSIGLAAWGGHAANRRQVYSRAARG